MKLSSKVTGTYSVMTPDYARDKLSYINKCKEIFKAVEAKQDIDIVVQADEFKRISNGRDVDEIKSALSLLIEDIRKLTLTNCKQTTKYLSFVRELLSWIIDSRYKEDANVLQLFETMSELLWNVINKDVTNNIVDMYNDAHLRYIKLNISAWKHDLLKDAPYDHRTPTPADIKNDIDSVKSVVTESIDGASIVKSISNYSQTTYFPQITKTEFSPEDYINGIYNESDDDYVINRIKNLQDFMQYIIDNANCYDAFVHVCEYIYDKFANNTTALDMLSHSLNECINILDTSTATDYSTKESHDKIRDYCVKLISHIDSDMSAMNKKPIINNSPLIEMGLDYIYDILPSNCEDITPDNADAINRALTEAAEENDMLEILTEAFGRKKTNSEIRREIKDEVENDIYRQRLQNKYYDERRREEDNYADSRRRKDDKYSDKRRASSDDYEDKRRREQEKYEKKQEEKERKKNRTKTAWAKWKTLELTNANAYAATRALKRLVTATAVGGVAYAAGFNPVFLPIVYLLSKYLGDKSRPQAEKAKIMSQIQSTQNIIDEKINQAEHQGDMKQKYELIRMRDKLDSQFKRMGFGDAGALLTKR